MRRDSDMQSLETNPRVTVKSGCLVMSAAKLTSACVVFQALMNFEVSKQNQWFLLIKSELTV